MGGKLAKDKKGKIIEDDFVEIDKFSGGTTNSAKEKAKESIAIKMATFMMEIGRKGRSMATEFYKYSNGKSIRGWFYKDRFIGSEPNEKLKKQLRKKQKQWSVMLLLYPPQQV
ncbi:hypothetical protein OS493_021015 [Desmophyllum pertusum]|uniref:Uncharacterized protein n=1 Tax=Desmophyllum pertusum TaxID=174260 RepID=A0A9X0A0Q8_9CNID|nr:hypothetical protein OS493_021015 [Desmophyllum pertusum]